MPPAKPAVYRCYDREGRCIYIGSSLDTLARLSHHVYYHEWAAEIVSIQIVHYCEKFQALEAEAYAIKTETPVHNVPVRRRMPLPATTARLLREEHERLLSRYGPAIEDAATVPPRQPVGEEPTPDERIEASTYEWVDGTHRQSAGEE